MNNQLYGWMKTGYYEIPSNRGIVFIPENADYISPAFQTKIYPELHQCEINMYNYVTDLITECNSKRSSFMQAYLLDNKIKDMYSVNNDYIINISYSIYNNSGQQISSGTMSKQAIASDATINSEISEDNIMDYRRAVVFDSTLEIQVPKISRYGIKNSYVQHPYTLVIDNISVSSTIGESKYIIESDTQVKSHRDYHHATHCSYHCHRPNHMHFNNFATHFLTNAKVGTTIIDQTVVPSKLEIPPEYTDVTICSIDCDESYMIKIDNPVEIININVEVLFDNIVSVYDKSSIDAIIVMNNEESDIDDELPEEPLEPDISDDEPDINDGDNTESSDSTTVPENNPNDDNSDNNEDGVEEKPSDVPDTSEDSSSDNNDEGNNSTS